MKTSATTSGVVVSLIAIAALSLWFFWPEPTKVRPSEPEPGGSANREASSESGPTEAVAGSLRVTVSDPRGLPLASVRVRIGDLVLETGEDGEATFAELSVRAGRVRCEHAAWGVLERDFDLDATDTLALEYAGTASLKLLVFPSGEPHGTTTIRLVAIGGHEPDRVLETREIPSATPIALEFEGLPVGRIRVEGSCEQGSAGETDSPSSGLASVRIDELRSGSTLRLQPTDCLTVTTRAREYQWFELHHADGSIGVGSFRPRVGGPGGGRFYVPILSGSSPVKLVLRGPPPPSRGAAQVPRFGETPQRPVHAPGLVELDVPTATRMVEAP